MIRNPVKSNTAKLVDRLSPAERSALMAKVKSKGGKSTERKVAALLAQSGIKGWKRNAKNVFGKPDFYFPAHRVAVFVDGCFWHGCGTCGRNTPKTRQDFWREKIRANMRRDLKVGREIAKLDVRLLRIWEHELSKKQWLATLKTMLTDDCE